MSSERRLAAIMFTDIVGYTSLMGQDQNKAYALLKENRQLQKPIIEACNGRWIKELGDGVLASFQTVSDAVSAAIRIQEECSATHDFQLRIGIHQGEVIVEDEDVFGDGVNIASRIESMGVPGSVLLSKSVRDQIRNNPNYTLVSLGAFDFKNVSEPVEVFALANPGLVVPKKEEIHAIPGSVRKRSGIYKWLAALLLVAVAVLAILYFTGRDVSPVSSADKSIAVLPFVNVSNDPEQEYFSDGISEEIINKLAQVPDLKVTGRTSSFSFKGRNMDVREIGEQLNVRHILEGSVRRSGNMLRITAQLIKVSDGYHMFSVPFDKDIELEDIFAIQDEISLAILDAVKIKLADNTEEAVLKRYTDNVEAYQLYLNGLSSYNSFTPAGFLKAIEYFDAAIALDSTYAIAYSAKAFCYMNLGDFNWWPQDKCMPEARKAAQKSFQLDSEIAESLIATGRIKLHWDWNINGAAADFKKALDINPNSAECHVQLGFCLAFLGKNEEAVQHAETATSLDPLSILNLWYVSVIPMYIGDYAQVLTNGKKMVEMAPNLFSGHMITGWAYLGLQNYDEAIPELELITELNPGLFTLPYLGLAYGVNGEYSEARKVVKKMKDLEGVELSGNEALGHVYASIGELDTAFYYYSRAIENREGGIIWIKIYRDLIPALQQDPRTREVMAKLGVH